MHFVADHVTIFFQKEHVLLRTETVSSMVCLSYRTCTFHVTITQSTQRVLGVVLSLEVSATDRRKRV